MTQLETLWNQTGFLEELTEEKKMLLLGELGFANMLDGRERADSLEVLKTEVNAIFEEAKADDKKQRPTTRSRRRKGG